jgi:LysR family transcriptional regulator, nitrogen assimilation regulatory protein
MDLKQLEYFVRVAELGSFTRAAQALDVAQPALSRQIRLLEVELRQTLLTRNGRGALPTEAGKLLLEHGRGILHQVARAREELGRVRGALAGRVAIGLPPSLARVLTVPLTRAFRAQLPQASLSITEGLSAHMLEWLTTGRLDIAMVYNAPPASDVELAPLYEEELLLVETRPADLSPAEEPPAVVSLQAVADLPLVIPSRPNAVRMQVEAELANLGLRPQVALEIDGVPAILDLVADGAGAAILSRNAVANSPKPSAYRMRSLQPALFSRLSLATSAVRPATLTQQTTLDLIRSTLTAAATPA